MLDRVREAIFSTLAPWLEGARVLDLFAGSGALSIEALSRGADCARLVEGDAGVRALEVRNLTDLALDERAEVVGGDALDPASWDAGPFDVVFCDPPFPWLTDPPRRRAILAAVTLLARDFLAPEGVVVLHVPAHALADHEFPAGLATRERVYGGQSIWYVQPEDESTPPAGR